MRLVLLCALAALCACAPRVRDLPYTPAEAVGMESRALSKLAALEAAVARFTKEKGHPPARLWELAPNYIGEIPALDLSPVGHAPTNKAHEYAPGAPSRDTGGWGYSAQDGRVFVDCTHRNSRERIWLDERGVF
jgi:hypothetical protein